MNPGPQIFLFGSPRVILNERPLPPFPTHKCRELFSYLVVHANRSHSRAMLAGLLWPEKTEEKARASLSTEIWRLRGVLRSLQDHLFLARDEAGFMIEPDRVDVHWFKELIQKQDYPSLTQAVELYKNDFLDGCYSDWCLLIREQLKDSLISVLEKLLHYHEARGNWAEAISHAKLLISYDPLREELHRAIMKLYLESGQRSAAIAQYQSCADMLMRELGIQPMPETQAMFKQIRASSTSENIWPVRVAASHEFTGQKLAEMKRSNQYLFEVFAGRPELDAMVDAFVHSQTAGFILTAPSGYGKTTWLAHLAESRIGMGDLVLYYDAGSLTLTFERDLALQLWGTDSALTASEALLALGREARKNNQVVWIFLDGLNSFRDLGASPADLLRRLDGIVSHQEVQNSLKADQCNLKIVITCRDYTWRQIFENRLGGLNWGNYFMNQPVRLPRFSAGELDHAFHLYGKYFDVQFPAQDITANTRILFSHPLLLRLTAEIWRGRPVPSFHSELSIFRHYIASTISDASSRQAVDQIVNMMIEKGRASIYLSEIPIPDLPMTDMAGDYSSLTRLFDAGILISAERGLDQVLSFAHDRLLEYLLAEHLLVELEKHNGDSSLLLNHARRIDEFPPLRGALVMALALQRSVNLFLTFAVVNAPGIRELCTDGLVALYGEEPQLAVSLSKQILSLESLDAKRAALRAVPFMREAGYEIFYSAVESSSEMVRRLALISLDQLWRRDIQLAVRIMRRLIDEVKPQTVLTSPRKIQTLLRIIGWFSNYGMPKSVLDEIDTLARVLAVEKLKLPTSESQGRLWPFIKRILSWNTISWPSNEEAIYEIVRPDGLNEWERNAFRRVLSTLGQGRDGLDNVSVEDVRTLLQSHIDPARYPAHHQLALWIHFRPLEAINAIDSIYDDLDGHARLWVIMAFLPSSIQPAVPFPADGLNLLEELTTRLAEENESVFLEGVERGALQPLGAVAFLPLAIRYLQSGKNDLPLLTSLLALAKNKPEKYSAILHLLAPLGWFHARETLDFLAGVVEFSRPMDSRLLETMGAIYVFHAGILDAFLEQYHVDDFARHRIRFSADVEQITYRARIISTQDVRVTSLLLGSPYGHWLTNCVMAGYLDSKTPREAARRFGEGLFESLRQCDWSLNRLFGISE